MRILIIAVHPDDETLGCGGTILKHKANHDDIFWVILTKPNRDLGFSKEILQKKEQEVLKVSKEYRFNDVFQLDFLPTQLHKIDFLIFKEKLSKIISQIKPETIYTVNRSDIHTDHQISSKVIMSSIKSFRNLYLKRVLMYECISETEAAFPLPENIFSPNSFSDITKTIEKKLEIMKIYETEMQEAPFPRSEEKIKSLASYRGTFICVPYAESFMLLKEQF